MERGFPNAEGVSEVFPQGAEDLARFSEGRRCLARFSERRGVQRGFPNGERRGARRVRWTRNRRTGEFFGGEMGLARFLNQGTDDLAKFSEGRLA